MRLIIAGLSLGASLSFFKRVYSLYTFSGSVDEKTTFFLFLGIVFLSVSIILFIKHKNS